MRTTFYNNNLQHNVTVGSLPTRKSRISCGRLWLTVYTTQLFPLKRKVIDLVFLYVNEGLFDEEGVQVHCGCTSYYFF